VPKLKFCVSALVKLYPGIKLLLFI